MVKKDQMNATTQATTPVEPFCNKTNVLLDGVGKLNLGLLFGRLYT